MNMLKVAREYSSAGVVTIPIALDGSKAPAIKSWKQYIERAPDAEEIKAMFNFPSGIAILGGPVSGGLEIIDFDVKEAFGPWVELVMSLDPILLERLPVVSTPNGFHVYFRSAHCEGNQKLASTLANHGNKKSNCIIETRGRGGYVIAPPSPAAVHPSGVAYALAGGPSLLNIPTITEDERTLLLNAARSFNEVVENNEPDTPNHTTTPNGEGRPGDDFAARTTWAEILKPHGWSAVRNVGNVTHWRRPGKDDKGISATSGFTGDKLYVFSSNANPFTAQRAYGKFSAYAWLNNAGDFSSAARDLKAKGFGKQSFPVNRPAPKTWDDLATRFDAMTPPHLSGPLDEAPPPLEAYEETTEHERITAEQLEALLDDDKAAVVRPEVFQRIAAMRNDSAEWLLLLEVCRRKRVKRALEIELKKHDRALQRDEARRQAEGGAPDSLRAALSVYGEIDVPGSLVVPSEYEIATNVPRGAIRLFRLATRDTKDGPVTTRVPVCDRVPIVSAVLHHGNGTEDIECMWPARRGKGWSKHHAQASRVTDAAKLTESFADYGFPVTSETRREMVRWIDAYMRANENEIEHRKVTESCGFQKDGGFLIGKEFIGDESKRVDFSAAGDGELQIVEGLSTRRGSMDGWRAMLRTVHAFPRLELALYASLAAPLLKPLGAANFAIEWAGKTSGGKTTALRLAASVWGENSESEDSCLLQNWSATATGLERYLSTMTDLPAIIDETQSAEVRFGKRPMLEKAIYDLTGKGKMRGAKTGSRSTAKWRTVLMTTGEQKLSDLMQGGGAAARVLTIWGSPTEGMSGPEVNALKTEMAANCGHAGQEWVRFIVDNKEKWGEWRELCAELQAKYARQMSHLPDQGVVNRLSNCMAVLGVAAQLAVDALELPWGSDEFDQVQACVESFSREIEQISKPKQALEAMADYMAARSSQILGSAQSNIDRPPPNGWLARVPKGLDQDGSICVFIEPLKRMLRDLDYPAESIIRQWQESGIIQRNGDMQFRTKARISADETAPAYRISLRTFAAVGFEIGGEKAPDVHEHETQGALPL